jgi:pachytene checkpoint protein 2
MVLRLLLTIEDDQIGLASSSSNCLRNAEYVTCDTFLRVIVINALPSVQGMSGRTLRRLPVLAHANYIGLPIPTTTMPSLIQVTSTHRYGKPKKEKSNNGEEMVNIAGLQTDVEHWLDAMDKVVETQIGDRSRVDAL